MPEVSVAYAADLRADTARYEAFENAIERHFGVVISQRGSGFGMRVFRLPVEHERAAEISAIATHQQIEIETIQPV